MLRAVAVALVVVITFGGVYTLDIMNHGFLSFILVGLNLSLTGDYGWGEWMVWFLALGIVALPFLYAIAAYRWARGL